MWNAVEAGDLTKIYRVYASPWHRVRELVSRKPHHREFRALEDVSFSIPRGEGLAIVGENGAGKSTLLKILAGITAPTSGSFQVRGKIASILELGSGFHPEFTGRQNIVLNAAMLGLGEEELRQKLPDIIGFSELGDFIDQPVKTYSTGMAMRLGFSIATQVEPDVLIIDEALSVGDGYFQKKCMDRLLRFVEGGGTLLFCSHAMYYVSSFCQRALWLRNGRAEALGQVSEVIRDYENFLVAKTAAAPQQEAAPAHRPSRGPVRISSVALVDEESLYTSGQPWELEIEWEAEDSGLEFHLGVGINRADEIEVCSFSSRADSLPPWSGQQRYTARLTIPELPLVKGEFTIYVFLLDREGLHIYDQRRIPRAFTVVTADYSFGLIQVAHAWKAGAKEFPADSLSREAVG